MRKGAEPVDDDREGLVFMNARYPACVDYSSEGGGKDLWSELAGFLSRLRCKSVPGGDWRQTKGTTYRRSTAAGTKRDGKKCKGEGMYLSRTAAPSWMQ